MRKLSHSTSPALLLTLARYSVLGLVLGITLAPSKAFAFPDEPLSLEEKSLRRGAGGGFRFHLLADLATYVGKPPGLDLWSVTPLFGFRMRFSRNWNLTADWGLAHATFTPDGGGGSQTEVRPGNPALALHYVGYSGNWSYRIGLGLTAPLAILPEDAVESRNVQTALSFSAAVRGNWDYWLWDPLSMSIFLPLRVEQIQSNGFVWGADLGIGVMIPVSSRNENVDPVIQMATTLGYEALSWLRVGSRFSLVIIPRLREQRTQLSVEPYARFGNDDVFGLLRILMNIDNPNGFAFDAPGVWGLRLGFGVAF